MFDLTQRGSYKNVPDWYRAVRRVAEAIPVVLVGNKADVKERQVKAKMITFHRRKGIPYFDISAKINYNFDRPFLKLARLIIKDETLTFVEAPAVLPPTATMTDAQRAAIERDRAAAEAAPLPDVDEF